MPETILDAKPVAKPTEPQNGELSYKISQSVTKQSITTEYKPPALEEDKTEKRVEDISLQNLTEDSKIQEKTEQEQLDEKNQRLKELFEELMDEMSPRDKSTLMDYLNNAEDLSEIFENDGKDEKTKIIDSLAELTRLIAIIAALISMLIFHPQEKYSGKDLGLPDDPPDSKVNDNEEVAKALYGDEGDKKKSWSNFRNSVAGLQDLSFGQFMAAVLTANDKNPVRGINIKEKGNSRAKKLLKNLAQKNMKKQKAKVRRPVTSPK